ncbi:hypothetical protein BH23PAT2_BH23PAT2_08320 [soil metagenome]
MNKYTEHSTHYNFKRLVNGKNKMRITVSKSQIHTTKEMLHHLGNPKSFTVLYDRENEAIKLQPNGDRVVVFSPNRENNPRISCTLGKYNMPLGQYEYVLGDEVFVLRRLSR